MRLNEKIWKKLSSRVTSVSIEAEVFEELHEKYPDLILSKLVNKLLKDFLRQNDKKAS